MFAISFAEQCCDADYYLHLGKMCAKYGECYESLRPMGSLYWFSLPYRLHLHPTSLIYIHILLALISVCLSVKACTILAGKKTPPSPQRLWRVIIILASIGCHALFLYPVWQHSLSDAPAVLLALIATWLLIISPGLHQLRFYIIALAGFLLGLAVWIRAFYLYPVLFITAMWFIAWIYHKRCDLKWLGFFLVLVPITIQMWQTYKHTGTISYIANDHIHEWRDTHLNSIAIGYDTLLPAPGASYRWESTCYASQGLLDAIKNSDFDSLACILGGRLHFYLGSYSHLTYTQPMSVDNPIPEEIRSWSTLFLIGNLFAVVMALLFLFVKKNHLAAEQWISMLFLLVCCIQSFLIIPEQRFVIMPMILIWLLGITALFTIKTALQTLPSSAS